MQPTTASRVKDKHLYPVDKHGNMLDDAGYRHSPPASWLPMEKFKASLRFVEEERGRSSFRLICKDVATGKRYSVMANSLEAFIKRSNGGVVEGEWQVVQRGASFGTVLLEEESVDGE
jgi:hypothetical protein